MIELISGNIPAQITDLSLEDIILRKQILSYLEKNSKMDPKEIAILLGTEPDVVENEIRKMEEEKIICGYHTMIDWDKTSSEMVTALIEVRVTPQRGQGFDSIAERIYKYPEVRSVYLISGGYDLMVILEGKTLKEVSQFVTDKLSTLDSVLSTATHFILKKYKDHGTIFDQKIKDERMLVTP
jgi:DNA-binding Lrp family transcriptional regulator